MIRTLIIEDEKHAVDHLKELIKKSKFNFTIVDTLNSVGSAIDWFISNDSPDLVFLDIQLADGISFELFSHVKINCPIIFTTAYQEYAIRAFKFNTIDYLLKPIIKEDFDIAVKQYFEKTNQFEKNSKNQAIDYKIDNLMNTLTKQYKSRFVVNIGLHIKSIEVAEISCFKSIEGDTFLIDNHGKAYDINYSLDQLENLLDPQTFFRINRKFIININAIVDIINYSIAKLKIKLKNIQDDELTVSRNRMKEFRDWLEK
jgi:DNA-binding LytR/AlgR family response regulator